MRTRAVSPLPPGRSAAEPEDYHTGSPTSGKPYIVTMTARVAHAMNRDDAVDAAMHGGGEIVDIQTEEGAA